MDTNDPKSQTIEVYLTVLEAMELGRLAHQFKNYPIIDGCYHRLLEAVMEQASLDAVKAVSDVSSEEHHLFYFPNVIADQ